MNGGGGVKQTQRRKQLPLTDELSADLWRHGIDPASVTCIDNRTYWGNGAIEYVVTGSKPSLRTGEWYGGVWAVKVSGRFCRHPETGAVLLFPSIGAALAHGKRAAE